MSGGWLIVLDRAGRDVKRFPLAGGMATLGADLACDIRVLQPQVEPHHATVVVHNTQSVVRNVGNGETLVNGRAVSMAALRHGDVITVGDRHLRWHYSDPTHHARRQHTSPVGALSVPHVGGGGGGRRGGRRASGGAARPARDRELQLAIEMNHRASMPGSTGGKQVAIVQPQRRDTNEQTDKNLRASPLTPQRRSKLELNSSTSSETESDKSKRKSSSRTSPKSPSLLQNTTKATLWIESRKTSPRRKQPSPQVLPHARKSAPAKKSTPLRLTVLKKAQSARKVIKIEAPLKIDHTKQAAIMLMTGHTPKSKLTVSPQNKSNNKSPSFVVKKSSPVRKTPIARGRKSGGSSKETGPHIRVTPSRGSNFAQESSNRRSSKRNTGNKSVTILEISDSTQNSTDRASNISTRSSKTSYRSPSLPTPKKSAMKDLTKKNTRKIESIKFDLSNLENYQDSTDDAMTVTNNTQGTDNTSEEDLTLHFSESSNQSPSPRKSIHSRSSRILGKLGVSVTSSPSKSFESSRASVTLNADSPRARRSIRGSALLRATLGDSQLSDYTKSDLSANTTVASAFKTRTLSPRNNLESYSVVDLVSLDSNNSKSIYNSAASIDTTHFGTPTNVSARKTRSTINPTLLGSSTPYVRGTRATRSKSSSNTRNSTRSSGTTRRSKSLSTPENKLISVNSTRVSKASRSRSRINDSDLLLLDNTEVEDSSPKTSKRSKSTKSVTNMAANSPSNEGMRTPENRHSPVEVGTPVLSIQSLLESSDNSVTRRKTIGVLSGKKRRPDTRSKSLGSSVRKTLLRLSGDSGSDKTDEGAPQPDDEMVTPKSAVKLTPESVKNKHSSAKKPLSKRSIIDNLNHSDHVKQLFNSPVKRKLSQSMTEFSRKQLFDDDDDVERVRRLTRNTVALTGRTPNNSILVHTETITPERFVSPIGTPDASPNLSGIKRLFKANTPENDLRNVRGVKNLLRTPRPRRSIKNDLTNVDGIKLIFAKSPRNRLSDVRVKEVFAASPNNDLRRVGGVKSLFQKPPKNDLSDVRGVKKIYQRKSPVNDLRNVSGVKRTLRKSLRNDLTDVRGVRKMFKSQKQTENYHDVSGVEELFNESNQSANKSEVLFDMLVGKPKIKAVYSKTFSANAIQKPKTRKTKSLHSSIDVITNNVEEWLQNELQKQLQSKSNVTRQLKMLATNTVEGGEPILTSRTRNSSFGKKSASEIYSAHTLPIKKRSYTNVSTKKPVHLPIKKRVVVHSTPVKGRTNLTMNASELGRVSPIAVVDSTREVEQNNFNTRSTQIIIDDNVAPKPIKPRTPRKQETPKKIDISKPLPKLTPEQESPPKRTTRNRKNTDNALNNTKKRLSSIVITKKAPVMTPKKPKAAPKAKEAPKEVSSVASPKKSRTTRAKKEVTIETPKRTRTRVGKATVVFAKPSPKMNPQRKDVAKKAPTEVRQQKPNRTRNVTIAEAAVASPKRTRKCRANTTENEPKTRGKKTEDKLQELEVVKPIRARRGRKAVEIEAPVQPKRSRNTKEVEAVIPVHENPKPRGRRNVTNTEEKPEEKQPKTRGKKVTPQTPVQTEPTTRGRGRRTEAVEKIPPKTRGKKAEAKPVEIPSKPRGKKIELQTNVEPKPALRSRRTKDEDTVVPETKGRKRKGTTIEEVPAKVAKGEPKRGKKPESPVTETVGKLKKPISKDDTVAPKRGKKAETAVTPPVAKQKKASLVESKKETTKKSTRGTRANKVEEPSKPVEKETKPIRGKQTAASKENIAPVSARGKRKAVVEPFPAKAAKKVATREAAEQPKVAKGRPVRGKPQPEVGTQAAGRSRRR